VAGMIKSIEKSNDLTGNGTRDLPACSTLSQPTTEITSTKAPQTIIPKRSKNCISQNRNRHFMFREEQPSKQIEFLKAARVS
jgi:hypothetical protein